MRSSLLFPVLLTGCFYISPGRHADELDPDGDGVPFGEDCAPEDGAASSEVQLFADADGDGFGDPDTVITSCGPHPGFVDNAGDCDDADAATHPEASERCDGLGGDEDCDGEVDEAGAEGERIFYVDSDGDGWGSELDTVSACAVPSDASSVAGDCDDGDPQRNPDAAETCTGVDDDCDELVDDEDPDVVGTTLFYADSDGDGFGDPDASVAACQAPSGAVDDNADCDDASAHVNPLATEACDDEQVDEDCDGERNESGEQRLYYLDSDSDGYGRTDDFLLSCALPEGYAALSDDCNDAHAGINPGATETCDADDVDENCNGLADDDDDGPKIGTSYHPDLDGDSFGDANTPGLVVCDSVPADLVPDGSDCDDASADIRPGVPELCDTLDNDCDGLIDDDDLPVDPIGWYPDGDGDGFGAGASAAVFACDAPSGYAAGAEDCDDGDASTHPDADEVCGGGDDDCDGLTDDADPSLTDGMPAFLDADADGFGGAAITYCTLPVGAVLDGGDCDDADGLTHPGAVETCAPGDRNCDGDPDAGAVDTVPFYFDADHDGHGDSASSVLACSAPPNHTATGLDCDDGSAAIHPGAVELCGGIDEDCDGLLDDADPDLIDTLSTFYVDGDGDGFGGPIPIDACVAPAGTVSNHDDCHDGDASVNPNGTEVCDPLDVDEDCNGVADDAAATAASKFDYYEDLDGDGYGAAVAGQACAPPPGFVAIDGDCDDTAPTTNPASPELCDASLEDEDCDGQADDADDDALGRNLYWPDNDVDGFGDETATPSLLCIPPPGDIAGVGGDCDDTEGFIYPGALEFAADGTDSDCDGVDAVCGDAVRLVPAFYSTIASAVAATCNGDQVFILPGTYNETGISVDTNIVVRGFFPSNRPLLDAQGAGPIFTTDGNIDLEHMDLANGSAVDGGCVQQLGGSLDVDELSFTGCAATDRGGALFISGDATVDDTTFDSNGAFDGGAVFVTSTSDLFIEDSLLTGNTALDNGGAVFNRGIVEVEQSIVDGNTAGGSGGGIYVLDWIDVEMFQVTVSNNTANDLGGGMMIRNPDNLISDANLVEVDFVANDAVNEGGGLALVDLADTDLDLDELLFDANSSGVGGGGMYLENVGQTDLDDVVFDGNTAPQGAAIYATVVNVDWDRSTVVNNVATAGSIVFIEQAEMDTRAIDGMDLITNTATDVTVYVQAATPVDVMRMDFSANPTAFQNLWLAGPVSAYNILTTDASQSQVYLETVPGEISQLVNSTVAGAVDSGVTVAGTGSAELVNNIIVGHDVGVEVVGTPTLVLEYNDVFGNTDNWFGIADPLGTNLEVDPLFVGGGDYHLSGASTLNNAGDLALDDPDGSRSSLGYYGGPFAQ